MRVTVLIAAEVGQSHGSTLPPGDRAAVHWGVALAGGECQVRFPLGDLTSWTLGLAAGARCQPWDDGPLAASDLLLIGPGAIDHFGDALAGQLAEQLDAELLFGVSRLERQGPHWNVVCDAGRGARDVLQVAGPLVAVVSEPCERPPYVSCYRLDRAARAVPVEAPSAGSAPDWRAVTPRPPRAGAAASLDAQRRANLAFGIDAGSRNARKTQIIAEEPAVCAQVLLRYLVHYGFVKRRAPRAGPAPDVVAPGQGLALTMPPPTEAPHAALAIAGQAALTPSSAIERGPRLVGVAEPRMARRPRPARAGLALNVRAGQSRLRRGPRRLEPGAVAGGRGPFPLSATDGRPADAELPPLTAAPESTGKAP